MPGFFFRRFQKNWAPKKTERQKNWGLSAKNTQPSGGIWSQKQKNSEPKTKNFTKILIILSKKRQYLQKLLIFWEKPGEFWGKQRNLEKNWEISGKNWGFLEKKLRIFVKKLRIFQKKTQSTGGFRPRKSSEKSSKKKAWTTVYLDSEGALRTGSLRASKWALTWYVCILASRSLWALALDHWDRIIGP